MRVAISQPEHFPYLGFFQKMAACDIFVLLDNVQFSGPRSFQNRNRFVNAKGDYEWFTVPVSKGSYSEELRNVRAAEDFGWRRKLKNKLVQNFAFPFFDRIYGGDRLIDINMNSINLCRECLGISTPMMYSSEIQPEGSKGGLLLDICKRLNADVYISGCGAKDYMKNMDFQEIKVLYFCPQVDDYQSSLVSISDSKKLEAACLILRNMETNLRSFYREE